MNAEPNQTDATPPASALTPKTTPPTTPTGAVNSLLGTGAQHLVRSQLNLRKEEAAWSVGNLARLIRQASSHLRQQQQEPVAHYTDRAATQMETASTYLHQTHLDQMVTDLEDLARRHPALFIAGGLILGIAAARFIKSSSQPAQP